MKRKNSPNAALSLYFPYSVKLNTDDDYLVKSFNKGLNHIPSSNIHNNASSRIHWRTLLMFFPKKIDAINCRSSMHLFKQGPVIWAQADCWKLLIGLEYCRSIRDGCCSCIVDAAIETTLLALSCLHSDNAYQAYFHIQFGNTSLKSLSEGLSNNWMKERKWKDIIGSLK